MRSPEFYAEKLKKAKKIRELRRNGITLALIGERFGMSSSDVCKLMTWLDQQPREETCKS